MLFLLKQIKQEKLYNKKNNYKKLFNNRAEKKIVGFYNYNTKIKFNNLIVLNFFRVVSQ